MPLDINDFRDDSKGGGLERLRASQALRGADVTVIDTIVDLDAQWRQAVFTKDNLRKEFGQMSKAIGQMKKRKAPAEEVKQHIANVGLKKAEIKTVEAKVAELAAQVQALVSEVGNYVHSSVPPGMDEDTCNETVRTWAPDSWGGEFKRSGDELNHHELLYMIGGYEPDRGVAISGHRGYFLTGVGVLLNQALINYGIAFAMRNGYNPVSPPVMMRKEIMAETAQLSEFDEALYKVVGNEGDEKYLIATSEQPISAFHRREWINPEELPLRYAGVSSCFRKEAGSSGKDCWGIFRVHQFDKVEQFSYVAPENSWEEHERMITISEDFYKTLGLGYRVVAICSGHLNNAAAKKYDLEAWFPTQGTFRELVSCSNCTDYQARAMETRFGQKKNNREKKYVHMLNATLAATGRVICCILENFQTPEGVVVPEVLRPFMAGMDFLPFVRPKPINANQIKIKRAADRKKAANKKKGKQQQQKTTE